MPNNSQVQLVFELNSIQAPQVIRELTIAAVDCGLFLTGAPHHDLAKLETVESELRVSERAYFSVEAGKLQIAFTQDRGADFASLHIEEIIPETIDWDVCLSVFAPFSGFRHAWLSDVKYERLQNAEDPIEYEYWGESTQGLTMKSNDLPPPLDQMIIDISGNPCRRVTRVGYIEAIGSTMWIGDYLWGVLGADRKMRLESSGIFQFSDISSHVCRYQFKSKTFTDRQDEYLQRKIRSLIFE